MTPSALPPIWVVNLARSVERRDYINGHLQALNLPGEIVPATDGRALSARECAELYSADAARSTIGRELTLGEIGCALSHLRLYQRMLDENVGTALILEDDALVHPDTLSLLARQQDYPGDWEILLLHHLPSIGGPLSLWHRRRFAPGYRIGRFALPAFGTAGYLITQAGARKLLAAAYPVRAPSDYWTGGTLAADVHIYGLEPPCITQCDEGNLGGTAMPDRNALQSQMAQPGRRMAGPWGWVAWRWQTLVYRWRLYRLKVWLAKFHPGKVI